MDNDDDIQPRPRLPPSVLRQRWLELLTAQPMPRRLVPTTDDPLSPQHGSVQLPSGSASPSRSPGKGRQDAEASQRLAVALEERAMRGQLGPPRRLYYRRLLKPSPAQATANASISWPPPDWIESLRQSRHAYALKRSDAFRAPDGGLPDWVKAAEREEGLAESDDGFQDGRTNAQSRFRPKAHEVGDNNPLSLQEESPWTAYLAQQAVMETIQGDVERLPDLPSPSARRSIARMLFVWCTAEENRNVGYRQGMHELMGILWTAVEREVIDTAAEDKGASQAFNARFVEHDAYALFEGLMSGGKAFYEWRDSKPSSTPYKSPILQQCELLSSSLRACDPYLASHLLDTLNIEPQLFALRWFRLIFTRELKANDAYQLWDALVFLGPQLDLVPHTALALILRLRSRLVGADQQEALSTLLNPARAMEELKADAGKSWPDDHTAMLVRQAVRLRDALTRGGDDASAAIEVAQAIARENESELGIAQAAWTPAQSDDGLDMPGGPSALRSGPGRYAQTYAARSTTGQRRPLNDRPFAAAAAPPTPTTPGYISSLATSLYGRAESMGVVSPGVLQSVQKTVGAYAAAAAGAGVGLAAARLGGGFAAEQEGRDGFPRGVQIGSSQGRGTIGIGKEEAAASIAGPAEAKNDGDGIARDRQLATALSGVIGVFESAWVAGLEQVSSDGSQASAKDQEQQLKTLAALTTLKHVRQVLAGEVDDFDPAILEGLSLAQGSESPKHQQAPREATTSGGSASPRPPGPTATSEASSAQTSPAQQRSQAAPPSAPAAAARAPETGPGRNARAFARAPGGDTPLLGLGTARSAPTGEAKISDEPGATMSTPYGQRNISPSSQLNVSESRTPPQPTQPEGKSSFADPLARSTPKPSQQSQALPNAQRSPPAARPRPSPQARPSQADPLGVGPL